MRKRVNITIHENFLDVIPAGDRSRVIEVALTKFLGFDPVTLMSPATQAAATPATHQYTSTETAQPASSFKTPDWAQGPRQDAMRVLEDAEFVEWAQWYSKVLELNTTKDWFIESQQPGYWGIPDAEGCRNREAASAAEFAWKKVGRTMPNAQQKLDRPMTAEELDAAMEKAWPEATSRPAERAPYIYNPNDGVSAEDQMNRLDYGD